MIYMDNAATTRMRPEVLEEMMPYLRDCYSNPSAIYGFAGEAKAAIDKARSRAAEILGVGQRYESISRAEELNPITGRWNQRLFSDSEKKHIIVSAIEHHAILSTASVPLERRGIRFTYIYPEKRRHCRS
jgi:cysteine desulfurase